MESLEISCGLRIPNRKFEPNHHQVRNEKKNLGLKFQFNWNEKFVVFHVSENENVLQTI